MKVARVALGEEGFSRYQEVARPTTPSPKGVAAGGPAVLIGRKPMAIRPRRKPAESPRRRAEVVE